MARAKFQGYASRKGFQASDPGYASLDRMRERDNRVISDLKENLRDLENRSRKAENNMREAQRNQEQNMKDIFIEEDVYRNQQSALQQNIRTLTQNKDAAVKKALAKGEEMNSLAKFSQTLATGLIQIREKDIQATIDDAYHQQLIYGASQLDRDKQNTAEELLNQFGHQIESQADMAARNGAMPRSVAEIRSFNQARDYGRLKANAKMAGEEFLPHAQRELQRLGITDPEGAAVALKVIHIDYLRQKNLYGLSSDFLIETHDEMRKARNTLLGSITSSFVKGKNDQMLAERRAEYEGKPSEESWNNLFWQFSGSYDGKSYRNFNMGVNYMLMEVMTDPNLTPDVNAALNYRIRYRDGYSEETWGQKYSNRIPEILRIREQKEAEIARAEQRADAVEQHKVEKVTKQWLEEEWDQDSRTLRSREKDITMMGYDTDFLKKYYGLTIQSQNQEWIKSNLEDLVESGSLDFNSKDMILSLKNPEEKKYYLDILSQFEEAQGAYNMSDKEVENTFNVLLKGSLGAELTVGTDASLTLTIAKNHAYNMYLRKRSNLLRYSNNKLSPQEASNQAYDFVRQQILAKEGDFEVVDGIRDKSIPSDSPLKKSTFFKAFIPSSFHSKGFNTEQLDFDGFSKVIQEVVTNKDIVTEKPLVDPSVLRARAKAANQGRGVSIPPIYYELAKIPGLGTPIEIFNKQLGTLEPKIQISTDDWRQKWAKEGTDSNGLKLIEKIDSIDGAARTYEILYKNGASNPQYMSPRTQRYLIPETPQETKTQIPDVLRPLIRDSQGALSTSNVKFKGDGVSATLVANDDISRNWLIDNGKDYGWYFNTDTGNFDMMQY